jgi:branched-chain amino acid transport system permease protein
MGDFLRVNMNIVLYALVLFFSIKVLTKVFDLATAKFVSLTDKPKLILKISLIAVALAVPLLLSSAPYFMRTVTVIVLYVVLALSLNIVIGFAGQLSIGHAAFYAVGAYTTAILTVMLHVNFFIAMIASALVAGLFGLLLGTPTLRLKGDYLAIVTIGFCEILRLVLINWISLTRGPAGIPGIPSPSLFGLKLSSPGAYYYLILAIAVLTVILSQRLLNSRLGRGLIAVRDDEIAAEAMGVNPTFLKILAFVLGAMIAGVAGSFFASFVHYVNPDNFNYMESVVILTMVVLGGVGSIPGVVVGAIILAALPELLRDIASYRYAIYGILLVMMMIIRPKGIISMDILKGRGSNG